MVRVGEISTAVRRSVQRGAALASGVSQQAVEEAAGIGVAGVIPARIAPTGKIPFDGTSFGDQDCNGCGPLGRPVCVKRRREVQPRLRLRHRIGLNVLIGLGGDDTIDSAGGGDFMVGGLGNDTYIVHSGSEGILESANEGIDTVLSSAHFRLSANVENLTLQGSADLQAYGNSLDNTIIGNAGNNLLDGDVGADTMMGGAGNDVYFVDNPGDKVIENPGDGNDAVFSTTHLRLAANVETLVLQGSADLQAYGNSDTNALYGNAGANILDGAGGADFMVGGAGNDVYFVDNAGDMVLENASEGFDTVFSTVDYRVSANVEALVLQGSANLQGYGNSDANALYGNAGANILDGGAGADFMVGGAGNDVYYVDNAGDMVMENPGEGTDVVFSSAHFRLSENVETLVLQGQ